MYYLLNYYKLMLFKMPITMVIGCAKKKEKKRKDYYSLSFEIIYS